MYITFLESTYMDKAVILFLFSPKDFHSQIKKLNALVASFAEIDILKSFGKKANMETEDIF